MALTHALYLALRSLQRAPGRAGALVLGCAVAAFLPLFTLGAGELAEARLTARADATPVVVGAPGSAFDLTLASLYFRGEVAHTVPASLRRALQARDGLVVVPLRVGQSAGGTPVVGTSPEYFEQRGLRLRSGRHAALLAEVVVGATAARAAGLRVGDRVRSDLAGLYDVAGATPLMLEVVGVLEPAGTPDDGVLFTDVRTCWAMDGALHGHDAVRADEAVARQGDNLEASAAVFMADELTAATRASFHLHGDPDAQPLSAVLAFPRDQRAMDLLLGDLALDPALQATRPVEVVGRVLEALLRLREGLMAWYAAVVVSTVAMLAAVTSLSVRLRRDELALMRRIGASPSLVPLMVGAELALVALAAAGLALALTGGGLALLDRVLTG